MKLIPANKNNKPETNLPNIRNIVRAGGWVLGFFLLIFLAWSILAPIEKSAIAHGKVIVDTNRKTIQHLEGGIVKIIHVAEGSKVTAGQPLITLDDTQPKARLQILQTQVTEFLAKVARLMAERDQAKTITWPARLLAAKNDPNVKKIMDAQQAVFETNKKALDGQLQILQQRIEQLKKQIDSLQAQVDAETTQLKLIAEEVIAVAYLEQRKLIEKPRLLALKREEARLTGDRGEHQGLIAKAQQQIGETQQQIITLKDSTLKQVLEDLEKVESDLADALEKEIAAKDILKRTIIIAPLEGTVVSLKIHTIGAVISPGEELMDIVPNQDKLIIEAEISPLDIDVVHPGLIAKVKLSAYKQRNSPMLKGKVIQVSPDIIIDKNTNKSYYLARIIIDESELKKYKYLSLYPGMPVQIMIITGKHSAFDYFIQPIEDSFHDAFREQ